MSTKLAAPTCPVVYSLSEFMARVANGDAAAFNDRPAIVSAGLGDRDPISGQATIKNNRLVVSDTAGVAYDLPSGDAALIEFPSVQWITPSGELAEALEEGELLPLDQDATGDVLLYAHPDMGVHVCNRCYLSPLDWDKVEYPCSQLLRESRRFA